MRNVRNFREEHLQRRTYANGESTVPRVKFMLREATVLAETLFPSWETAATAIVRNTSKRKKFYEIIVICVNNEGMPMNALVANLKKRLLLKINSLPVTRRGEQQYRWIRVDKKLTKDENLIIYI